MTTSSTPLANPAPDLQASPASAAAVEIAGLLKDLGRDLVQRRTQLGMSRTGLAKRIGFSYGAVSGAEYGQQTRSRQFWELADQTLGANGALLAAADRISLRYTVAKRDHVDRQLAARGMAPPLAPYRQVQRTHRVFADRLGAIAARRQRHPQMVETAARQQTRAEHEVQALTETIRTLLRRPDFTDHDVLADLWQTLLTHDPYNATFVSAAALMELARTRP